MVRIEHKQILTKKMKEFAISFVIDFCNGTGGDIIEGDRLEAQILYDCDKGTPPPDCWLGYDVMYRMRHREEHPLDDLVIYYLFGEGLDIEHVYISEKVLRIYL
jgi:hypothetical protein